MGALLVANAAQASDYAVGQIWSCRTGPGEEVSHVLIDKIEDHAKLDHIFHASLSDLKIRNRHAPEGYSFSLPHLPVSQQTLDDSVLAPIGRRKPDSTFEEGYAEWKPAFDAGKAGIWTTTSSNNVRTIEKGLSKQVCRSCLESTSTSDTSIFSSDK